jgi:tetratricopeptide (TPR) repeat protein
MSFKQLYSLVRAGSYDPAYELITRERLDLLVESASDELEGYRRRCLLADVWDYVGQYDKAKEVIGNSGSIAKQELESFLYSAKAKLNIDLSDSEVLRYKRLGWVSIHHGMTYYRADGLATAKSCFARSLDVFKEIDQYRSCTGSLARATYCLGLVARNDHDYDAGRRFMAESVELAWERMQDPEAPKEALQFHIGKCLGLGMSWIAYTRASLADASALIVAARLLLADKEVKFIAAYLEIVHACSLMSAHGDSKEKVEQAMETLRRSFGALGGRTAILGGCDKGHPSYAVRAAVELASGHVRLARLNRGDSQEAAKELENARELVDLVKRALGGSANHAPTRQLAGRERRSLCAALILECRILREAGDKNMLPVLEHAIDTQRIAGDMDFAQIDSRINLGEAYFFNRQFETAREQFQKARDNERAQTNPKILAVCDLKIATCLLALGRSDRATDLFRQWLLSGRRGSENSYIRRLGADLEGALQNALPEFFISSSEKPNKDVHIASVRRWMAISALRRASGDPVEAAKALGITTKTLSAWQTEHSSTTKRRKNTH